tara:strand:+ start:1430 stop:1780 length:351 start_codon:yes stop_codon:yes gene_type:complete
MSTEKEKAALGAKTFQNFCGQFGEDVYSQILLEVLLEGIINAETLFVFGEQEQRRDQDDHGVTRGGTSELRCERSGGTSPARNVATPDSEDRSRQQDVVPPQSRIGDELRGIEEDS